MERNIKEVLLSEEQIQSKVKEMAAQISREYEGKNPVFVGVLKGVVIFFADFVRNVTIPCEIDFMSISSYSGTTSTGRTEVRKDVSVDIRGRHVIILEDIFDTGNSLTYTVNHLLAKEPASLKVCTFLDKPDRRKPGITLQPEYVGYTIPNEFVVGYGLDFNEHYRNLPYIGILKPEVYEN
jgi:hypoxanthine phosphoribosyltransferase